MSSKNTVYILKEGMNIEMCETEDLGQWPMGAIIHLGSELFRIAWMVLVKSVAFTRWTPQEVMFGEVYKHHEYYSYIYIL